MLNQENIDAINRILGLCGTVLLTTDEIEFLNALDVSVTTECDLFIITQNILLPRLKNQKIQHGALSRLKMLASSKECAIEDKKPERPRAVIPILGGRLR